MHGTLWLENKTSSDIDRVAITIWPVDLAPLPMPHIQGQPTQLCRRTDPHHRRSLRSASTCIKLPQPLPPHGRIQLDYSTAI